MAESDNHKRSMIFVFPKDDVGIENSSVIFGPRRGYRIHTPKFEIFSVRSA